MRLVFAVILLFIFIPNAISQVKSSDSTNIRYHWDVFYTEKQDPLQSADVYWNNESKNAKVLLFVHGGGWLSGDKEQYREMASNLAENGITVVLINYRLSPLVRFPSHIEDVASAIHWTYSFINKYNGDKESIYLMGHSAGGHLISLILCDEKYLGRHKMVPFDIAGAITISGVFEIKPQEGDATRKYLGLVFGDNETIWERASCKNHIDPTTKNKIPYFMVSWGKEEEKLIVNESLNLIKEFEESQIEFRTYIFEEKDHYAFKNDLEDINNTFFKELMQFMGNQ